MQSLRMCPGANQNDPVKQNDGLVPRYTGEQVTMRSVLGDIKGWPKDVKLWQRNSWSDPKSVDEPAYTATSGAYHMGAPSLGELTSEHNATWEDRARLQLMEPEVITANDLV